MPWRGQSDRETDTGQSAEGNDGIARGVEDKVPRFTLYILSLLVGRSSEGCTAGQEYRRDVDNIYYASLVQERGLYQGKAESLRSSFKGT
jgi:hypothetical protein